MTLRSALNRSGSAPLRALVLLCAASVAELAQAAKPARPVAAPPPAVAKQATALAVAPVEISYGGQAKLRAVLHTFGTPVTGKTIGIELDGKPLCGTRKMPPCPSTDGEGIAEFDFLPGLGAGAYEKALYASFVGDTTHGPSSANASLHIAPAALTVTAKSGTSVYGAPAAKFEAVFDGFMGRDGLAALKGELVCASPATPSSPVGECPVTCSGLSSTDYDIRYAEGVHDITPAPLTVTADSAAKTYGAELPALGAGFVGWVGEDSPAQLTGELRCETDAKSASPVGEYAVRCSGLSATNYALRYVDGTLSVTPAPLTVTATPATKIYGEEVPELGAAYTGFVLGDDAASLSGHLECATLANPFSRVGAYAISCGGLSARNYRLIFEPGALTVTPAPLKVTARDQTKLYGAPLPPLNEADFDGLVGDDDPAHLGGELRCTTTATAADPVGAYPITCSGLSSPDYQIAYAPGELAIVPAPLTVTAVDQRSAYGSPRPRFTAAIEGFALGEDTSAVQGELRCDADAGTEPGDYPVRCEGLTSANYALDYVEGTFTITKAPLTVTANDKAKIYAQPLPAFDAEYQGFVNGEGPERLGGTLACTTDATPASRVGEYSIRCAGLESPHYEFTYRDGRLTVTQARPVLRWDAPAGIVYGTLLGDAQLNARADVAGTFLYTPAAGTRLAAGAEQTLRAQFTPADAVNYESAATETRIDVRKAVPQVTWEQPAQIVYGTPLGSAQLDARADVAGIWSYDPEPGTVLGAGADRPLRARFVAEDPANYEDAAAETVITVLKAAPQLEWPAPEALPYGMPLDDTQLAARADVPGAFRYTPDAGALLDVGPDHRLTAHFTPADAQNYLEATAQTTLNVMPAETGTTITGHWLEPSLSGQSVTVAFRVAPATTAGVPPQGRVTVSSGPESCVATLETGQCALPLAHAGRQQLTARYAGDGHYRESEGSAEHQVDAAMTATDLRADREASAFGEPLALTANVAVMYPGAGRPTGEVEFFDNAKPLGSSPLDRDGTAQLLVETLAAGMHALSAKYAGDEDFRGSASMTVQHTVSQGRIEAAVTVVPATQQFSDEVTLTATVPRERPGVRSPLEPGAGASFKLGRVELGSCALAPKNDVYTCSVAVKLSAPRSGYSGELQPSAQPKIIEALFEKIAADFTLTGEPAAPLVVTPEDAYVSYTGPLIAWTTFRDSTNATVELSASVRDTSAIKGTDDAARGDVTRATLGFVNLENGATLAGPFAAAAEPDGLAGEVKHRWTAELARCAQAPCGEVVALGLTAGGHYTRAGSPAEAVLTIAQPGEGAIAGAAIVTPAHSGALKMADLPSHVGFHVNYAAGAERTRGRLVALVRSPTALSHHCAGAGAHVYLIGSESLGDLDVDMVSEDIDAPPRASFTGSARIVDITDAEHACEVEKNAAFTVSVTDGTAHARPDGFAFAVWNGKKKLLFATDWKKDQATERAISAGDIVVR